MQPLAAQEPSRLAAVEHAAHAFAQARLHVLKPEHGRGLLLNGATATTEVVTLLSTVERCRNHESVAWCHLVAAGSPPGLTCRTLHDLLLCRCCRRVLVHTTVSLRVDAKQLDLNLGLRRHHFSTLHLVAKSRLPPQFAAL